MAFMFIVMGGLIVAGVLVILMQSSPRRTRQAKQSKFFLRFYRFFSKFFITQSYIARIYGKLANLSIYRRAELQVLSVKYFLVSWGVGGALVVLSFFLFSDILTVLIVIIFALLLTNILVDKQLDKMNLRVMKSLAKLLGSIRQEYMRTGSVVEAVTDAECDDILKKPLDDIATILISTNGELKLQEFCEATPYRTIQTLAGVCYHINNQGDEKDIHGQSNFNQALTLMLSDVNSEIQKAEYRRKRFGKIEYLPFIPILGIGAIESYFISIMPGTALIYNGPLGYLMRTITVLIAAISYSIVSRVNCDVPFKEDDRSDFITSLLEKPFFKRVIHNITPKNKARAKVELNLKTALSRMSVEHLYAKKLLVAFITLCLAIVTAISTISLGREFILTSTQELSLVATNNKTEYELNAIRAMDEKYLADPDSFNRQQVEDLVKTSLPGLSDLQVQDQIKRLESKKRSLENAYFKWWYFWICVGVAVVGWFGPNMMLSIRKKLVETEEEEDFIQLQTLVSILMNTNMDTLDILYELSQHSRVHRDMFIYAYQGYPSNPELEISRLQAKTPIIDFKRFLGKLKMTISDLSLKEAYSDLLIERDHMMKIRDMTLTEAIDRRRSFCGPLSMAPLASFILGEFLIPIGILGYNEFMNALQNM